MVFPQALNFYCHHFSVSKYHAKPWTCECFGQVFGEVKFLMKWRVSSWASVLPLFSKDHSGYGLSQWEMMLHCNVMMLHCNVISLTEPISRIISVFICFKESDPLVFFPHIPPSFHWNGMAVAMTVLSSLESLEFVGFIAIQSCI